MPKGQPALTCFFARPQANKTAELELPEANTRAARDAITLPDTYADLDLFAASADFESFAECELPMPSTLASFPRADALDTRACQLSAFAGVSMPCCTADTARWSNEKLLVAVSAFRWRSPQRLVPILTQSRVRQAVRADGGGRRADPVLAGQPQVGVFGQRRPVPTS